MTLQEKDFVRITYTARLTESRQVFDTTDEAVAKAEKLTGEGPFGPQVICLGQGFTLIGLEKQLIGKKPGSYNIQLKAEDAFGKKDAKLIKLFPTKKFLDQHVNPEPGIVINMDGMMGMIRTVSGGRTTVDFNHPLSGKDVEYDLNIIEVVDDKAEKVKAVVAHILDASAHVELKDDVASVGIHHDIPPQLLETFKKKIIELSGVKDVQIQKHAPHASAASQ